MKISYSNLSWNTDEDEDVVRLFKKHNIKGIELACSKIWENPTEVSAKKIKEYRKFWNDSGISIVAITSLLYGNPELSLFNSTRKTFIYLQKISKVAEILGAKVMMFGSPKNRIKGKLSNKNANEIAATFFYKLAEYTSKKDISIVIEPNPSIYGGDYILNFEEAIDLCKIVNHDYFGLNIDSGTIAYSSSDYTSIVKKSFKFGLHGHISEPFLKTIPGSITDHNAFSNALRNNLYKNWLSVEVALSNEVNHIEEINKTLNFVSNMYKNEN